MTVVASLGQIRSKNVESNRNNRGGAVRGSWDP